MRTRNSASKRQRTVKVTSAKSASANVSPEPPIPDELLLHTAKVGFAAARKDVAPYGHLRLANKGMAAIIKKAEEDEIRDMCKKAKLSTVPMFANPIPKMVMVVKVPFKGAFYNVKYESDQWIPLFWGNVVKPMELVTVYRSSINMPLFKMEIDRGQANGPKMAICRFILHVTSIDTIATDILRLQTFQPLLYKVITCPELAAFKMAKLNATFDSAPNIEFRLDEVKAAMLRFAEPLDTWTVAMDYAPLTITGIFVQSLDD